MDMSEISKLQINLRVLASLQANEKIYTQQTLSTGSIQVPRNYAVIEGAMRMWSGESRATNIDSVGALFDNVFLQLGNLVKIINGTQGGDPTELFLTALDSMKSFLSLIDNSMKAFDALMVTYAGDQRTCALLQQLKQSVAHRKDRILKLTDHPLLADALHHQEAEAKHEEEPDGKVVVGSDGDTNATMGRTVAGMD